MKQLFSNNAVHSSRSHYHPAMFSPNLKTPIGRLRIISLVEALSYLILLFIAMPLKYVWGEPMAVRIVGMAHGLLFCLFCAALLNAMLSEKWGIKPPALIFLASLIPFAPIWVEKWLKKQTPRANRPKPLQSKSLQA